MRSCLKCSTPPSPTPPPAPTPPVAVRSESSDSSASSSTRPTLCHKHVSFRPAIEEAVYVADEWDRTPMDPCRRLSYSDVLELKQMHATLPRAEQAPETAAYMPRFLKQVPIHLLPLLPAQDGPKTTSARDMFKSSPKSSPPMSPAPSPTSSNAPLLPSPSARNAHTHTYAHAPSPLTKGYTPPTPPPRATGYGYGAVPRLTSARNMFAKPASHPPSPPATPPPVQKPLASTTPAPPKRRLNMSFVPLISSSEPISPPAQEHPTFPSAILIPDAEHEPRPPITSAPSVSNSSDASSGAEIKRSPSSVNSNPPHDDQPHSDLATPSSTPALTARSLDDTDTETSMPPTPAEPELALPGSNVASAGAPDAQQSSPSRRRMDLNEHLDQFPAPPTSIPDGPSSSSSTTTSSLRPSSPPSPAALSKRLAHLANGAGPSPSDSNGSNTGTSSTTTPSATSDCTSMSSSGASSVHEGPWGMSYFGLPLRGKAASHPTAAVALPPHLRRGSGAALPDSPFIDPMMMAGGPRAPPMTGPLHSNAPSGHITDRSSMHLPLTMPSRALKGLRLEALPSPSLVPPSPLILGGDHVPSSRAPIDPVLVPLPPPVRADGLLL